MRLQQGGNEQDFETLTVLVHDMAGVRPDSLVRAQQGVERIFSRAGVGIHWLKCPDAPPDASGLQPCPPRPAGTIVLRIVPTDLEYIGKAALGYALPGRDAMYATVSLPRVQLCVSRQKKSAANLDDVLGHAMAHEIAHILLGTNSHSPAGLMRADWDSRALDDVSKGRLNLLPDEEVRVRDAVARRVRGDMGAVQTPAQ